MLRFGLLDLPDAPFAALVERWRRVEELGFDFLFVADHYRHERDPSLTWFDGWTTLAAMAMHTQRVRIGPLVANPILRGPAIVAKAASAIDHLSEGRLELAIAPSPLQRPRPPITAGGQSPTVRRVAA